MPVVSDAFLSAIDKIRALQGPAAFNIVPSQLTITQRQWSGRTMNVGALTTTTLAALPQYYLIRELSPYEVASSGGRFEQGDLKMGPITPPFAAGPWGPAGGFGAAQLFPSVPNDSGEIVYTLTGNHPGEYALRRYIDDDPTGFFLVIRRLRATIGS